MKLRIKGNSIRLRLTKSEVNILSSGEAVTEKTQFTVMDSFEYKLERWLLNVAGAKFEKDCLTVSIPEKDVERWVSSDFVTLEYHIDNQADGLKILIEKDFACLSVRPGEDDSDSFPNPSADISKC